MERQFTRQAENALKLATTIAKSCGHGYIGTEHLLAGLFSNITKHFTIRIYVVINHRNCLLV